MITMVTPPTARPTRCRQRFRSTIVAGLALIAISLAASASTASASDVPKCVSMEEEYDLRNAARDSNVILAVHEQDDKEAREQLCQKLESTPQRLVDAADNGKETVFAYLELTEDNRNFARNTLNVKDFPSFLYVSKGMDKSSKFSNFITHQKGSDSLDQFIESKVGFRLGGDVFTIRFFDAVASRFVSYGDATGLDRAKQRVLALLVRFSTLFSWKEPFTSLGILYNRAFSLSFEHGIGYSETQVEKLEKRLDKGSFSKDKIYELDQKIVILKSFSKPTEVTPQDDKDILIQIALLVGLFIATLALFYNPSEDEEVKKDDGEEAVNAEPIVAKPVD